MPRMMSLAPRTDSRRPRRLSSSAGRPNQVIAGATALYRLNPWSPSAAGQSSQMSPVTVIVANPCRVRSRLAVPVIVVILLSW
jgi:hypothetical protein